MPRRLAKSCTQPGCSELAEVRGRCTDHAAAAEAYRGTAAQRGYDNRWRRTRARFLAEHPRCECDGCLLVPYGQRPLSVDVDHRDGLGPRGPRGHDPSNLRAMAHGHHSARTARDQPGGWAAER